MNIGFKSSKFSFIASVTSFVALSHTLITALYLSSSVIKPRLNCFLICSTCSSAFANISAFAAGTLTSAAENVTPASVEYLNPVALI